MRQHKYRAWDKVNKRMMNKHEWRFKGWQGEISTIIRTKQTKTYGKKNPEGTDNTGADIDDNLAPRPRKEFVLMQWTGLQDKNGVDIYEGDIVKVMQSDRYKNVARYEDELTVVGFQNAKFILQKQVHKEAIDLHRKELEVIGNIYENPELLNK